MIDSLLSFSFEPSGAGGRCRVTALWDGARVQLDSFDPSVERRRTTFGEKVHEGLDAIGVSLGALEVENALLKAFFAFDEAQKAKAALTGASGSDHLEPWGEEVLGDKLAKMLVGFINKFCALPASAAPAMALWLIHTYCYRLFDVTPRLALTSPVKRCGKSTALSVLESLANRPLAGSCVTGAALFHVIDADEFGPTVLIDEYDLSGSTNHELRAVLNAGHRSNGAVPRVRRTFRCYAPVAYAAILSADRPTVPETLRDRSIEIPMRRRSEGDLVAPFHFGDVTVEADRLRRQCLRFVTDNALAIRDAARSVERLSGLDDRAQDNWRPLRAIASVMGEGWSSIASRAATELSAARSEEEDRSVLMLRDIGAFFGANEGVSRVFSRTLVTFLQGLEESSWDALTPQRLARILRPFDIRPKTMRHDSAIAKGYERADFESAWSRYVTE